MLSWSFVDVLKCRIHRGFSNDNTFREVLSSVVSVVMDKKNKRDLQ